MRHLLPFLLITVWPCLAVAQQQQTDHQILLEQADSLAQQASTAEEAKILYLQIIHAHEENPSEDPGSPEILAYRRFAAELRMRNGLGDSSMGFFLKSIELWKQNPIDSIGDVVLDNYNHIIIHHGSYGRLDTALRYGNQAMTFADEYQIPPCTVLSALHQNMSICYRLTGAFRQSQEYSLSSIAVSKLAGDPPVEIARSYVNLGRAFESAGVYAQAVSVLDTAIGLFRKDTTTDAYYLVDALVRKVNCLKEQGHFDKSIAVLNQAKEIKSADIDSDDEQMSFIWHYYATHYERLHDYERALDYQLRIISNLEKFQENPESYEDLAVARGNLGGIYQAQGRPGLAQREYDAWLEMCNLIGERIHHLSHAHRNLGHYFVHAGDTEKAIAQFEQAGAILLERYGPNHNYTALFYQEYGEVLKSLDLDSTALVYYRRARTALAENQLAGTGRMIPLWYHIGELFHKMAYREYGFRTPRQSYPRRPWRRRDLPERRRSSC
jgi:tetratricopeptide (TPR) repeat protein